jgi:MoaA/NifB/PqqE/SkfB family radical SAM enzyme
MYIVNIREESFGGTLFNLKTGKRYYINKEELKNILDNCCFPSDIDISKDIKKENIKFVPLKKTKKTVQFSFADIVFLEVTRKCNLHCKHCLNNSGKSLPNELSQDELKSLINEFANHGVQDIRFTGGEPLLYDGIYDLIKLASSQGIYTSIGTNGTLVTEEIAKKLKDCGLNKAVVSIDGTKKHHDFIRGNGQYEKAIQGLENLQKQGISVRVNSVIMRSNMDDVISFAKELNKKQIHVFLRRFIESGRGANLKNNMMSKSDYEYVKEQLKDELKEKNIIGHYLHDASGIRPRIVLPFRMAGCKAGQRSIAIMADGDIQLCGFLYSQGMKGINNIRNIKNWNTFWNDLQKRDELKNLRSKLNDYNKIPGIQETYCLAYIKLLMNKGEL